MPGGADPSGILHFQKHERIVLGYCLNPWPTIRQGDNQKNTTLISKDGGSVSVGLSYFRYRN